MSIWSRFAIVTLHPSPPRRGCPARFLPDVRNYRNRAGGEALILLFAIAMSRFVTAYLDDCSARCGLLWRTIDKLCRGE